MLLKKTVQIQMELEGRQTRGHLLPAAAARRAAHQAGKMLGRRSWWPWTWPFGEIVVFGGGDADSPRRLTQATTDCNALALVLVPYRAAPRARACAVQLQQQSSSTRGAGTPARTHARARARRCGRSARSCACRSSTTWPRRACRAWRHGRWQAAGRAAVGPQRRERRARGCAARVRARASAGRR